jgi:hypothetical protein
MIILYVLLGAVGMLSFGLFGVLLVTLFTYFYGALVGVLFTALLFSIAMILRG